MKNLKITKNSKIGEILPFSEIKEVFQKYGLSCFSCPMIETEAESLKIEDVCQLYGVDVEKLVNEINKVLEK